MNEHLWLIGMMGSGKTTVGPLVAERAGLPFIDIDETVAERAGCSVATLWGKRGEAAFRQMEAAAIASVSLESPSVVATGGGAVLDPSSVATMRRTGTVVWLAASAATLQARVGIAEGRPLLDEGLDAIDGLLAARAHLYSAAAHAVVDTDDADPAEISASIEALWKRS